MGVERKRVEKRGSGGEQRRKVSKWKQKGGLGDLVKERHKDEGLEGKREGERIGREMGISEEGETETEEDGERGRRGTIRGKE